MRLFRFDPLALFVLVGAFAFPALGQDEPPRTTDARLKIELFAESPQVVTPTGIDVDQGFALAHPVAFGQRVDGGWVDVRGAVRVARLFRQVARRA